MINEAKMSKRKIFIWDEPALQGLKKQWWNSTQINLVQLLMMARKNQHLFIFNITDFTEFNKYIIRRAICMLRIYKRKENDKVRRFLYFGRKKLRLMYENYTTSHKRKYTNYATRHGSMPNVYVLPLIISEDAYEDAKDVAIQSIGEDLTKKKDIKLTSLQQRMAKGIENLKAMGFKIKVGEYAKAMGISDKSTREWREIDTKEEQNTEISTLLLGNLKNEVESSDTTINKGLEVSELVNLSPNGLKQPLELANIPLEKFALSNVVAKNKNVVAKNKNVVAKEYIGEGILPEELGEEEEEEEFD
jgi:hypothetical protein